MRLERSEAGGREGAGVWGARTAVCTRHRAFRTRLVSYHSHLGGCEFTPFTDEDTGALSCQEMEVCPNDGGWPCVSHGDGDTVNALQDPSPMGDNDEDAVGSDGEAQVVWEPEGTPNQPGVSGAPQGGTVCSGTWRCKGG